MARVLVVDDSPLNLDLTNAYPSELGVQVVFARSGHEALAVLRQERCDLVLLDVMMPTPDGFEVCRQIKSSPATSLLPVVMVTGLDQSADRVRAIETGADDFLSKPVERTEIVARVCSLLRVKSLLDRLDDSERVMVSLARAVEAKDAHTEAHVERVGRMARRLGEVAGLREQNLEDLFLGGVLHDIGKIGIPDSILNKPGPLTAEEMDVARNHVFTGEEIVRPLRSAIAVVPMVRHHHERIDGSGYPDQLRGSQIPVAARIVAICDGWDAITSDRPYRRRSSLTEATQILWGGAGAQWDRELVAAFMEHVLSASSDR
ncbi:MAG TPA: HD domain-containing phosphohydrolase [Candidatus Nitrosotalea sp.]|nr:HD domain-containing phosphohydrolase [Candidatus Nitrosotalea sp.]